jgi:hypothetical protein
MTSSKARYPRRIPLLISEDDNKIVKKLKRELNCSNSEIFRQAIRDFSKRYEAGNLLLIQGI